MHELYHKEILKHAKTPEFTSQLKTIDSSGYAINQFCGDEVRVNLSFRDGIINDIHIDSKGCSINIASSSLMAVEIKDLDPNKGTLLIDTYKSLMNSKIPDHQPKRILGSLAVMESVKEFPIRIKCALLCTQAFEDAVSRLHI
tara:strand:+ start:41919 stop:42347 length:429 start_codon:yes stop_codon:yes gene_type:complete